MQEAEWGAKNLEFTWQVEEDESDKRKYLKNWWVKREKKLGEARRTQPSLKGGRQGLPGTGLAGGSNVISKKAWRGRLLETRAVSRMEGTGIHRVGDFGDHVCAVALGKDRGRRGGGAGDNQDCLAEGLRGGWR